MEMAKVQLELEKETVRDSKEMEPWISSRIITLFIAYLHLIVFTMMVGILAAFGLMAYIMTTVMLNLSIGHNVTMEATSILDPNSDSPCVLKLNLVPVVIYSLWFIFGVLAFLLVIQFWAASRLLDSTDVDIDLNRRLGFIRFWRVVTVVYLTIDFVTLILFQCYKYGAPACLFRIGSLYLVQRYKKELQLDVIKTATVPLKSETGPYKEEAVVEIVTKQ